MGMPTSKFVQAEIFDICGGFVVRGMVVVVLDQVYYVEDGKHAGKFAGFTVP